MFNTMQNVMKKPVKFCDKCLHPITSTAHEYECDRLAKIYQPNNLSNAGESNETLTNEKGVL